ncbi:MAG: type III-A CRISPR-associated RAMP protein Csm3 [Chlorobium phaeobacteroides]|uniref:CRISPR system Cms endoribonuclease Csm3 n=1 Tax=Chlorobium phaeobacteroides (strain BS1) TaxID=331678 RepID=B3EIY6_CHLPB|nr:type III-A CRISPR-associated RAMP protein Csm3 [Chlorobium phaeobacteroides]MBL6957188.1 type III-A CRISPR-associated RAMP protein Csm3 [Chlorobium phaeobacteroides]
MQKLIGKVRLSGRIKAETGLHIGGSKTALDIGGIDLNVIKTPGGVPFIPGSSLKGKLRSILAREHGSMAISKKEKGVRDGDTTDEDIPIIIELFGNAGDKKDACPSRIIVRDAFLDKEFFNDPVKNEGIFSELEMDYTESKWENTILRKTGTAINPRPVERVPVGTKFDFEIIYNVFNDDKKKLHLNEIIKALRILEDDYLGGLGSRGYGKISFPREFMQYSYKSIENYKNGDDWQELTGIETL